MDLFIGVEGDRILLHFANGRAWEGPPQSVRAA